ncbi:MAG: hypothetical protein M3362_01330 [Acidobacteriota bacterium]|nr:hypothetical protein [Acidobacteriota bacterium]
MARSNLQIKEFSYTGDGTDNRNITGIGFRPNFVAIKNVSNNSVFRTSVMRGDSSGFLTSSNGGLSDRIQTMLDDGFQIGTAAQVNTLNQKYYGFAIRGTVSQKYFKVGNYFGTGVDGRDFTVGGISFTPDFVLIQRISTLAAVFRTSAFTGDATARFDANANAADFIQNLQASGFQLGTSTSVNASGIEYFWFAMKALAGAFAVGSYVGTAVAKSVTGVGFKPDVVIIKNGSAATQARILTASMVTDAQTSLFMGTTATDANGITSLDTDGFTVGTGNDVNGSGNTCYWMALKSGNFNAPLSRTVI